MLTNDKEQIIVTPIQHPCLRKWRGFTDDAERRGGFTDDEKWAAWNWNTCAIAEGRESGFDFLTERCQEHPEQIKPVDDILRCAGVNFYKAVVYDDFRSARMCLTAIEARLNEILNAR